MDDINEASEIWTELKQKQQNKGVWKPINNKGKLRLTKNFLWYASVGKLEKIGYKFQCSRLEDGWIRKKGVNLIGGKMFNDVTYAFSGASTNFGNNAKDAIQKVTLDPETAIVSKSITNNNLDTSVVFLAGRTFAGGMALQKEDETPRSLDNTFLDVRSVTKLDMFNKRIHALESGPAEQLDFPSLKADSLGAASSGAKVTFNKENEEPVFMQVDGEFVALLNPFEMSMKKHKNFTFLARK